jgi:hypothetical protein
LKNFTRGFAWGALLTAIAFFACVGLGYWLWQLAGG